MEGKKYIPLKNLDIYKLARELSRIGWEIYESCEHWLELLYERGKLNNKENYSKMKAIQKDLSIKLNNFISSTYRTKQQ